MQQNRKVIFGLLIVAAFIFLVTTLVFAFALSSNGESVPTFLQPVMDYHLELMVLMGFFGVASGIIIYSLMNENLKKQEKIVKTNHEILMQFLSYEEREVFQLLLDKEGMTTQSEIARLPGMTRLKAHRVVKRLQKRGIVFVEKYGKINMIRLVEELRRGSTTSTKVPGPEKPEVADTDKSGSQNESESIDDEAMTPEEKEELEQEEES